MLHGVGLISEVRALGVAHVSGECDGCHLPVGIETKGCELIRSMGGYCRHLCSACLDFAAAAIA